MKELLAQKNRGIEMVDHKRDLIRVFVKGGIISPPDMYKVCEITEKIGNRYFHFGSRQDILFPARDKSEGEIARIFEGVDIRYTVGKKKEFQNIVSSFVSLDILDSSGWVSADTYHYILENFEDPPQYKINIVDPNQTLVPFFTGHLNFIASRHEHYWFLYVRYPGNEQELQLWPRLVHSQDISKISDLIITNLKLNPEIKFEYLTANKLAGDKAREEELIMPDNFFPNYEGFNMAGNQYWLGLYWRNNKFATDFMKAACRLCMDTNIGAIHITPWKSFIIKNISPKHVIRWEKLMGKFGINVRHSSLELNWHLPVNDDEALALKQYLVRELDQQDISTYGLTFTIKTSPGMVFFTSIVIEKAAQNNLYSILYARDFNPNSNEYFYYVKNVKRETLPALLIEISKIYYRQLNPEKETANLADSREKTSAHTRYQCANCLTIYDQQYGDPLADVPPGTPFDQLPVSYKCSVCESGKEFFRPL